MIKILFIENRTHKNTLQALTLQFLAPRNRRIDINISIQI